MKFGVRFILVLRPRTDQIDADFTNLLDIRRLLGAVHALLLTLPLHEYGGADRPLRYRAP